MGYELEVDGIFGWDTDAAVRQFQWDFSDSLDVDGIVGPQTWKVLRSQKNKMIQLTMKKNNFDSGKIDGIIGSNTKKAIEKYQENNGLEIDGIVGPDTWGKVLDEAEDEEPESGETYQMYHGTSLEIANDIANSGFVRSSQEGNMLGAGIYLSRSLKND